MPICSNCGDMCCNGIDCIEKEENINEPKKVHKGFQKGYTPWNKGNHLSEEHRQNISNSRIGELNFFYKKKHSEETIIIISEKAKERLSIPENNPRWNGGTSTIPVFKHYAPKMEPYEECRRNELDPNLLEIKCTYCGIWFVPTVREVRNRIIGINTNDQNRFYCSSLCRKECPIYNQKKYTKGYAPATSREVQPELRQLVFTRDKYECQKCGSKESLHCHHIDPVVSNPIESADTDNCITLCKDCHKWCHMNIDGCGYGELANCL